VALGDRVEVARLAVAVDGADLDTDHLGIELGQLGRGDERAHPVGADPPSGDEIDLGGLLVQHHLAERFDEGAHRR
jgi:hypothetical protein